MLKGIDPRLNADVLWALAAAGHGDRIALVDANFPGESVARAGVTGRLLRIDASNVAEALAAVLTLLPVDTFVDDAAVTMDPVSTPGTVPPAVAEMQSALDAAEGRGIAMRPLERFAFYEAAREAFAVIQTLEERPYGNVVLRKGVILSAPA